MAYHRRPSSVSIPSSDDCPPLSSGGYSSSPLASPSRMVQTPESSSSPGPDPLILCSSNPAWDFGFNRQTAHFRNREIKHEFLDTIPKFALDESLLERRCSSEDEPPLMSDFDTSECSEDIDVGLMKDEFQDGRRHVFRPGHGDKLSETVRQPEAFLNGPKSGQNQWNSDIDVAAALLDLSREVRIGSSDAASSPAVSPTESHHRRFSSSLPPSSAPTSPISDSVALPLDDDSMEEEHESRDFETKDMGSPSISEGVDFMSRNFEVAQPEQSDELEVSDPSSTYLTVFSYEPYSIGFCSSRAMLTKRMYLQAISKGHKSVHFRRTTFRRQRSPLR